MIYDDFNVLSLNDLEILFSNVVPEITKENLKKIPIGSLIDMLDEDYDIYVKITMGDERSKLKLAKFCDKINLRLYKTISYK